MCSSENRLNQNHLKSCISLNRQSRISPLEMVNFIGLGWGLGMSIFNKLLETFRQEGVSGSHSEKQWTSGQWQFPSILFVLLQGGSLSQRFRTSRRKRGRGWREWRSAFSSEAFGFTSADCWSSLSTGWKRISRHRAFQKGMSLLRTKSWDNMGTASTAGWPPDRPGRIDSFCGLIANVYSLSGTPLQYSCLENPMDGGAW